MSTICFFKFIFKKITQNSYFSTYDDSLINISFSFFESVKQLGDSITSEAITVVASYDSSYAIVEHIFAMFPCRYINEDYGQVRSVREKDFDRFNHYLKEMAQDITKDLSHLFFLSNNLETKKELT